MKKLQQGSSALTAILVIILVLVVAFGVYMYVKPTQSPQGVNTTQPIVENTQPATPPAPDTTPAPETAAPALPPHAGPNPIAKVYTDRKFGFSVTYPQTRTASTDKAGKITLAIPNSTLEPITIVKATTTADTSTGKWGKNILSYSASGGWVTQMQNDKGVVYSAATDPFAYTPAGLPIFNGGTKHGFGLSVYVVALSHTKFLIISGGEGLTTATGYDYSTDPTLQVAKAVTVL